MRSLKQALDAGGHCLLEMPTGTGKTVCLLSLITSYQFSKPACGKLIYCTRTVPEMNHVMEELATVLSYRAKELAKEESRGSNRAGHPAGGISIEELGSELQYQQTTAEGSREEAGESSSPPKKKPRKVIDGKRQRKGVREHMGPIYNEGAGAGGSGVLALCLSSRRNMCVHERVMAESDREAVDAACRSLTATWVIEEARKHPGSQETCTYFDNFQSAGESITMPSGVYDLQELKEWGKGRGWCPYYLTRQAINHANVLVFNYQYMLDPKVAKMVSKELEAESIVVFDEAHNIDSVCIEALSVTINDRGLEQATRSLGRLSSEVTRMKATDTQRLQDEYQNLLNGLIDQCLIDAPANEAGLASVSVVPLG
jgi:DNA excision repair protein ERCC-2